MGCIQKTKMIQKTNISEFMLNYRSVFVVAVSRIFEGEQDYGEHTSATPTLQRSYFLRGVVNMVAVSVKVRGEKSMCFCESLKSCLCIHQKLICAPPKKCRFCISLFCEDQDHII